MSCALVSANAWKHQALQDLHASFRAHGISAWTVFAMINFEYACTHPHPPTHTYTHPRTHPRAYAYAHMLATVQTFIHERTRVGTFSHPHAHARASINTRPRSHTHTLMHTQIHTFTQHTHTPTLAHAYAPTPTQIVHVCSKEGVLNLWQSFSRW